MSESSGRQAANVVVQSQRRPSLPLRAYADAVSIAEPYVRARPTEVGSRAEAVRQLVASLSDEGVPGSLRGVMDPADR